MKPNNEIQWLTNQHHYGNINNLICLNAYFYKLGNSGPIQAQFTGINSVYKPLLISLKCNQMAKVLFTRYYRYKIYMIEIKCHSGSLVYFDLDIFVF